MSFFKKVARVGIALGTGGSSELYRGIKNGNGPVDTVASMATGGLYGINKDDQKAKAAAEATARNAQNDSNYGANVAAGQDMIRNLYGESGQNIGADSTNYSNIVKNRLNQDSVSADLLNKQAGRRIAQARARAGNSGGAASENEAIARQGTLDAAAANQNYHDQSLALYGSNIGARQKGVSGIDLSSRGLANASQQVGVPASAGGILGSIICTELLHQGKITQREWVRCSAFGYNIHPRAYFGYLTIATPVVKLMRKSDKFSNLFIGWAKSIAKHKPNLFTRLMLPLCYMVGYARKIEKKENVGIA